MSIFNDIFCIIPYNNFNIKAFKFTENNLVQEMTENYAKDLNMTLQQVLEIQKNS